MECYLRSVKHVKYMSRTIFQLTRFKEIINNINLKQQIFAAAAAHR